MKRFALLAVLIPIAALVSLQIDPEQPAACPAVDFRTARQIEMSDWKDTYLLFREDDASYSGARYMPVPPYTRFSVTPNFDRRFTECIPKSGPGGAPIILRGKPPGAGASPVYIDLGFLSPGRGAGAWPHYSRDSVSIFVESTSRLFGARSEHKVGENPQVVTGGDYDRDGNKDIAVLYAGDAPGSPGGVAVLRGNGDGTFRDAIQTTVADSPTAFAQSDLNGDGVLDFVVAVAQAQRVDVLIGDGDGTFTVAGSVATPAFPIGVTLADIAGDNRLDLLVAHFEGVSVFPGSSGAGFGAPTSFAAGPTPSYVAAADLNRDGRPDLAVASRVGRTATILLGTAPGAFGAARTYAIGFNPLELIVADFDANGTFDLIAGAGAPDALAPGEIGGFLSVLLGRGDGSFLGAPTFPVERDPTAAAVADLNGDGRPDIVSNGRRSFSVLLNDGSGGYAVTTNPIGDRTTDIVAADFNRDQRLDVALADESANQLLFLAGNGNGTFQAPVGFPARTSPNALAAADFNQDGFLDVALAGAESFGAEGKIAILLGDGNGRFTAGAEIPAGVRPARIISGDWNRDGAPDLAVVESGVLGGDPGGLRILTGNGSGGFGAAAVLPAGLNPTAIAAGDLNADGLADLAVTTGGENFTSQILLYHGWPGGGFGAPISLSTTFGPVDIELADFNGDSLLDMAVGHCCGEVHSGVRIGKRDGSFSREEPLVAGADVFAIEVAELNADGKPDLIAVNAPNAGFGAVSVLTNISPAPNDFLNVSGASFEEKPPPPASIVTAVGEDLAAATAAGALPLPQSLGGLTIAVRDYLGVTRNAGIYFVSPKQVNYVLPGGTALGPAKVVFQRADVPDKTATVEVRRVSPSLFFVNADRLAAALVLRVRESGEQEVETIARFDDASQKVVPIPIDLGPAGEQVFLELFGVGIRGRDDLTSVSVTIGGVAGEVLFAGDQGGFPGMDQVNVRIPRSLIGAGAVEVVLVAEEISANIVRAEIK